MFRVGHTLLHMPQSHLHTRRSVPQGQLFSFWDFLDHLEREGIWNAVVNRCANSLTALKDQFHADAGSEENIL